MMQPECKTLLIVDDDQNTCEALQDYLEDEGYHCLTASSGQQAIEIIEKHSPQAVFLDIKLPDMTGIDVLREIKQNREDLMVIMISGYSSADSAIEAMNAGAYTYLKKPVQTGELMANLNKALEKRRLVLQVQTLIKDLKKTNQDLTEANRLKDEFLSICSHDIKSPLTAITTGAYVLESEKMDNDKKQCVFYIQNSAKKILALVNDLLDISKLEAGGFVLQKSKIQVKKFLLELTGELFLVAKEKGLVLECSDISSGLYVFADALRLEQVIRNLLSNAMKFSRTNGKIVISAKQKDLNGKPVIAFSIHDDGIGIPEDKIPKLFDKFVQARKKDRQKGTGLGLAICKQICERHGGKIWVESQENKGTTFLFTLPISDSIQNKEAA